jgi:hypothetical protein
MWVATHKCMEETLGISLSLSQTSKNAISYYLFFSLFNKIREEEGRTGSAWKRRGGGGRCVKREVAQTMYTCVIKCKNDKRRRKKLKNLKNPQS